MLIPLQSRKVRLVLLAKGDPKLKFIPNGLINFVMKFVSMRFMKHIMKIFQKVNDTEHNEWKQRIESNREFYDWLREKLEIYHKYN